MYSIHLLGTSKFVEVECLTCVLTCFLLKEHALPPLLFPLVFCGVLVAGSLCTLSGLFHFVFGMFSQGYTHLLT